MMINRQLHFVLGLTCSLFLLFACSEKQSQQTAAPPPPMPVISVSSGSYSGFSSFPVSIEGVQSIQIMAKVSGYIQDIYVDEGQKVRRGASLFKLETTSMSQSADAANSAINTAEAEVATAQLEVDRIKPLVEKNVISEVQLSTAKANLNAAKSRLEQAKSNHQTILADIGYSRITSPVDGVVGTINLRPGSLVGPSATTPLTTVSDIDKIYAYFSMNEGDFIDFTKSIEGKSLQDKLDKLPEISLVLADGTVYEHKGRIDATAGNIDARTGAVRLRAVFDNPDHLLRDGSSGVVRIPESFEGRIAIPSLSTFEQQGKTMVYIVGEGDTLRARPIEIESEVENVAVVKSGLKQGDRILAMGVGKVRASTVISPQPTTMDSVINSFNTIF